MGKIKNSRKVNNTVTSESIVDGENRSKDQNVIGNSTDAYNIQTSVSEEEILFSNVNELRKAVIYAEVLGKPRAIRNYHRSSR